jgi:putative addiction module killer protein
VYLLRRGEEIIILLCGGDKDTQANDIRTAKRLAKEWREENA